MGDRNDRSLQRPDPEFANIGKKPNRVISVPPEYQRVTISRECETFVHTLKVDTKCDVVAHWRHGKITFFEIFGGGSGLGKAVRDINHWILKANTKSKESAAWAKMPAFDNNKWYYDQVNEMEHQRKQMFKGPIPEGGDLLFKAFVEWPEDLRTLPEPIYLKDVFGTNLEGLDAIRVDDEVFITPVRGEDGQWKLEIQGYNIAHVESAEQHIDTMVKKVRIQAFSLCLPEHIILDWSEGDQVKLEAAGEWWPTNTIQTPDSRRPQNAHDKQGRVILVPRLINHPMMHTPGEFRKDGLHPTQLATIQRTVQLALEAIRFEKGYYDFYVRFGCLGLNPWKLPENAVGTTYSTQEFLSGIDKYVNCETQKWLVHGSKGEELLARLVTAEDLLKPIKSAGFFGYTPSSLKDTRPTFRGSWVFHDPTVPAVALQPKTNRNPGRSEARKQQTEGKAESQSPITLYVVQVDWTDDEEGLYEKMEPRFFRLRQGETTPKYHIDLKLLELGEGNAWQFCLESMTPVFKNLVSPALRGFAESVRIKPGFGPQSKGHFATWTVSRSLTITTGRLDKIYTFGIQKTGYKVEVISSSYPQQKVPCWGINVRHHEWAGYLAELETLPSGRCADWKDPIRKFLPDNGLTSNFTNNDTGDLDIGKLSLSLDVEAPPRDGIRLLMRKIMQLSEIINDRGGVAVSMRE